MTEDLAKIKERSSRYYLKHKDRMLASAKSYAAKNEHSVAEYQRAYRKEHAEEMRAYFKEHYLRNKEKKIAQVKKYRDANKDKISVYKKVYGPAYHRQRRREDPAFRIRVNLSSRLCVILKSRNSGKSSPTMELVGCSTWDLKRHLQALFREGMSWGNYGSVWEVDHIKPCALFNLLDQKQQGDCFHYSNLQPLFVSENRSKNSKYMEREAVLGLRETQVT